MAAQPNVVVILSDDHGYADRGVCGVDPLVVTPHLDTLAASGVTCTDAYVTAPICSPSRAGLIAGRYQARWGVHWFGDSAFPSAYPSIAERFTELGYATGYLGKVHYGKEDVGDRGCPPHHGFAETFYGLAGQQMGRLNYLHHSEAAVEEYGPAASWRMAVQPMLEGDEPVELEGFLTDELGRRACDFITRHGGIRVPFLVRWPAGGIAGGRRCDGVVSSMDLYPSLLAAAGADAAAYADADGRDQLELWRAASSGGHGELHWDIGYSWAVRAGAWKLTDTDGSSPTAAGLRIVEHAESGDGRRLTDLRSDPGETRDLADERPDIVADLVARHDAWVAAVAAR